MSSLKKTASAINIGTPKLKRVSHEELEQFCLFLDNTRVQYNA
jgi:hypothetical protein